MKIITTSKQFLSPSQRTLVLSTLRRGGVIVYPTDTSYGIGCDGTNQRALQRVFIQKKRSTGKPVSVMVSGIAMAKKYSRWNLQAQKLAQRWWPGPLTVVLERRGVKGSIGMRVPNHVLAQQIVRAYHKPIVTTSANISGRTPCYSIPAFLQQLKQHSHFQSLPDVIINVGALAKRKPSTVVDARSIPVIVLRAGAVRIERLRDETRTTSAGIRS